MRSPQARRRHDSRTNSPHTEERLGPLKGRSPSSAFPLASFVLARCAALLKKSPAHGLRQEITPPETMAEVQRDTLNGKAGGPAVSQLPDAPVLQRRLPLSPDRSSGSSRGDKL
jgi:hypothetical protein